MLRLVAQTLLVAIRLHALATLVLIDFRFTAFLQGTHDTGVGLLEVNLLLGSLSEPPC